MRRALRFFAIVVVAAAISSTTRADGTVMSETAHYRLVSSGTQEEADDWTKALEAAWPQYEEFFGKAPTLAKDERLSVAFFEDAASMEDAIKKAGGKSPGGEGGYYDPISKGAYLYRQPSKWYTRALLLHEAAHQFHFRAKGPEALAAPFWYREGIAEHLSRHTWDGETLRIGVEPMLSLENYAGEALKTWKAGVFDLEKALDGKSDCGRPEAMHLVRYLCCAEGGKLRPKFNELAAKFDRGTKLDAKACAAVLGSPKKLVAAVAAWLPSVQEPWQYLTNEWDDRGADALRGFSPSQIALCRRRADTRRVTARMRPLGTGAWKGGVLLRYDAPDDYDIGMLWSDGRVRVDRKQSDGWKILVDKPGPAADGDAWRVEGVRDGGSVKFVVNGTTVATVDAPPGSMGLAIDSSTADFTEIAAE
jgi:hypothetical protein